MTPFIEGNLNSKILLISDFVKYESLYEGTTYKTSKVAFTRYERNLLIGSLTKAGLMSNDYAITCMYPFTIKDYAPIGNSNAQEAIELLKETVSESGANILVPLGEAALRQLTGLKGINKWHLSILNARAEYGGRKVVPLLNPREVMRNYKDSAYISFGARRISDESLTPQTNIPERKFILGPSFEEAMKYLEEKVLPSKIIAIDIETGRNQINTVGIAISATEAIAIKTLPDAYSAEKFHKLWLMIKRVMESDIKKIAQNYIYETQYLSKYGIYIKNIHHCTMACMKFLHPELNKGLDNIGRLYTKYPYWKEDGKDWGHINNWLEHLAYNCKDTTGTYAAYEGQVKDLKVTKTYDFFYNYLMKLAEPVREMCTNGLLLNEIKLENVKKETKEELDECLKEIDGIIKSATGDKINVNSPIQLRKILEKMKFKLIKIDGKYSTNRHVIGKLKKKYPKEKLFPLLIQRSTLNKLQASYLNFNYDSDKRVRYSLSMCATETGRMAGYKDPWGNGFNPQTLPARMKHIFVANKGHVLVEIDLKQAESRYVAWDAPDVRLMEMLKQDKDIHSFVAGQIFNKSPADVTPEERRLGKKSGHGANYGIGTNTFVASCADDLDLFFTEAQGGRILRTYHETFPGIRRRQKDIEKQIGQTRKLVTPLGRIRYFYDRISNPLFREAYAYCPQSVIPDIINHLMLYLKKKFPFSIDLLLQVHDSILFNCPVTSHGEIIAAAHGLNEWHPKIVLTGGELVIPIEVKVGTSWGEMEKV